MKYDMGVYSILLIVRTTSLIPLTNLFSGGTDAAAEGAEEAKEDEDDIEEEGEEELLQDTIPGPLGLEGKEVEDVLNIISQSIYREGEGKFKISQ